MAKYKLCEKDVENIERAIAKANEATVKIEHGQVVVLAVKKEKM